MPGSPTTRSNATPGETAAVPRASSPEEKADAALASHVAEQAHLARLASKDRDNENRRVVAFLRKQVEELESALGVAINLRDSDVAPRNLPIRARRKEEACAVVLASDWHVEERVEAAKVNGVNAYSPAIARKRAARFVEGVLWLLETERAGARVETLVLGAIGDFITGWIHEENLHGNDLAPTEAVLLAQDLLCMVVSTLLKRGGLKTLRVVCSRGNHGRITKKTHINAAARLSYEWLMFKTLAQRFEADRRVEFIIEDGLHTYVEVYDRTLRFSHGDSLKYEGGVGGLTIPLRKAIGRWNKARRADLDLIGHWHQLQYGGDFVVNGSLIGWNGYAAWIGASPEPPQQAFLLMRPGRGVAAFAPIFVTE